MSKGNNQINEELLLQNIHKIKTLAKECLAAFSVTNKYQSSNKKPKIRQSQVTHTVVDPDYTKPIRPFIKTYTKKMSGPKKFTVLLAHITKGDLKKEISFDEIHKQWDKMTSSSLLGMKFNPFYSAQAKDNDWVESKKKGMYNLRPSWKNILL